MRFSKLSLLGVLAMVVFVSCGSNQIVSSQNSSESKQFVPITSAPAGVITLAIGESITISPENLIVTFSDIPHESRCPMNAYCFWEGMAVVELTITESDGTAHTLNLSSIAHAPGDLEPAADLLGYTFSLVQVTPYPDDFDPPIPLDAYEAHLTIEPEAATRNLPAQPSRPSKVDPFEADEIVIRYR